MSDKCAAHDACIGRIHDTLDDIRDEVRNTHTEIKEMLHDGALVHKEHGMRIEILERKLAYHGVNWKEISDRSKISPIYFVTTY